MQRLKEDALGAGSVFRNESHLRRLAERLQQSAEVLQTITTRHRFIALLSAASDETLVKGEIAALEDIKRESLMALLTEMQGDAAAGREEARAAASQSVEEIKAMLQASEQQRAEAEKRRVGAEREVKQRTAEEEILRRLQPLEFGADLSREQKRFLHDT